MKPTILAAIAIMTLVAPALAQGVGSGAVPLPPLRPEVVARLGGEVFGPPLPSPPLPPVRPKRMALQQAALGAIEEMAGCPALSAGRIVADALAPISEGQCGASAPLSLISVNANGGSIAMPANPTVNCAMANTLSQWLADLDGYARETLGAGIEAVISGPAYVCRRRNNAQSGRISEHAYGNAIDVVGFELTDGRSVRIVSDWQRQPSAPEARLLAEAHGSACEQFTTVLGPEANALHYDHFHLDLGCHGRDCTYTLCQ